MGNANDVVPAEYVVYMIDSQGQTGYYYNMYIYGFFEKKRCVQFVSEDKACVFPSKDAADEFVKFITSEEAKLTDQKIIHTEIMKK